jgi:hypothetical protein
MYSINFFYENIEFFSKGLKTLISLIFDLNSDVLLLLGWIPDSWKDKQMLLALFLMVGFLFITICSSVINFFTYFLALISITFSIISYPIKALFKMLPAVIVGKTLFNTFATLFGVLFALWATNELSGKPACKVLSEGSFLNQMICGKEIKFFKNPAAVRNCKFTVDSDVHSIESLDEEKFTCQFKDCKVSTVIQMFVYIDNELIILSAYAPSIITSLDEIDGKQVVSLPEKLWKGPGYYGNVAIAICELERKKREISKLCKGSRCFFKDTTDEPASTMEKARIHNNLSVINVVPETTSLTCSTITAADVGFWAYLYCNQRFREAFEIGVLTIFFSLVSAVVLLIRYTFRQKLSPAEAANVLAIIHQNGATHAAGQRVPLMRYGGMAILLSLLAVANACGTHKVTKIECVKNTCKSSFSFTLHPHEEVCFHGNSIDIGFNHVSTELIDMVLTPSLHKMYHTYSGKVENNFGYTCYKDADMCDGSYKGEMSYKGWTSNCLKYMTCSSTNRIFSDCGTFRDQVWFSHFHLANEEKWEVYRVDSWSVSHIMKLNYHNVSQTLSLSGGERKAAFGGSVVISSSETSATYTRLPEYLIKGEEGWRLPEFANVQGSFQTNNIGWCQCNDNHKSESCMSNNLIVQDNSATTDIKLLSAELPKQLEVGLLVSGDPAVISLTTLSSAELWMEMDLAMEPYSEDEICVAESAHASGYKDVQAGVVLTMTLSKVPCAYSVLIHGMSRSVYAMNVESNTSWSLPASYNGKLIFLSGSVEKDMWIDAELDTKLNMKDFGQKAIMNFIGDSGSRVLQFNSMLVWLCSLSAQMLVLGAIALVFLIRKIPL